MNGIIRMLFFLYWWGIIFGYVGCILIVIYGKGINMCFCDVYVYKFMWNMFKVLNKICFWFKGLGYFFLFLWVFFVFWFEFM